MKKSSRSYFTFIQVLLSFLIVLLMPIYLFFVKFVLDLFIIKNEIPFPRDLELAQIYVNQEVIYSLLFSYLPLTLALAASFFMVFALRKRKKSQNFSSLLRLEKILLLTPVWHIIVTVILMNIGEHTVKEFIFSSPPTS